jgi:hypothetical protein
LRFSPGSKSSLAHGCKPAEVKIAKRRHYVFMSSSAFDAAGSHRKQALSDQAKRHPVSEVPFRSA